MAPEERTPRKQLKALMNSQNTGPPQQPPPLCLQVSSGRSIEKIWLFSLRELLFPNGNSYQHETSREMLKTQPYDCFTYAYIYIYIVEREKQNLRYSTKKTISQTETSPKTPSFRVPAPMMAERWPAKKEPLRSSSTTAMPESSAELSRGGHFGRGKSLKYVYMYKN